ncbi:SMI1/KNR4 family protein [Chryseobacterium arthrosphaerae]|uniref:SMI1/KNR4 family protein n=1 Tax=Chryseobacterium arthrosphaerae TaxID=651561 RepID=UPI001E38BF90|nr:SMI1/KNR4 family protein [Chryseobacterium arthrosphaerae]UEQ77403.1 SMI1/KNR4 family protein [Chryseobacterium arthrosphaerae]
MKIRFPNHWLEFIKVFTKESDEEIVAGVVRVFRNREEVRERYDTYQFEEFLPGYIPVADDSGGQVAVISEKENDPKVYLSSYGVLQKELLKVLDRDLLHWMQRRFPFDQAQATLSPGEHNKKAIGSDILFQRISSYPEILKFLEKAVITEGLSLPENYAAPEQIYYFQDGYHYNSVENKDLTGNAPGDFKPDWIVLATNYFADPFFVDLNEHAAGFPVYFAYHGQGYWQPLKIADSLEDFQKIIDDVHSVRWDKKVLSDYFKPHKDSENPFWKEVYEAIENQEEMSEEAVEEKINDLSDWREANLYITDIGPNKMKIIALLKKEHHLSGAEAMKLSKSNRILFRNGYYKWLQKDYEQLIDLGAQAEFDFTG